MYFDNSLLEFNKVKTMVSNYAQTSLGKFLVDEISPSNNVLEINRKLSEAAHALKIIDLYKEPPFGGIRDLSETLKRAQIYSVLKPFEFLDIIGLIEATNNMLRFYKQVKENEIEDIALDIYFENIESVPKLKMEIQYIITDNAEVSDSASPTLRKIRNSIRSKQTKITEKLNLILNRDNSKLAESLVTIRNNRFVVPIKLSEKNNFKGAIIDYSSSGETVYMEPIKD